MKIFLTCFQLLLLANVVFPAADLEIKTLRGIPAKEFSIDFSILNHGPAAANRPGCNLYFYANERLVLSQTVNLAPLEAGKSRKETLAVDLPSQAVTAVKVEVFDSEQPDTQPSTNFLQMNIKPPDLRTADLQILEVKAEDLNQRRGGGYVVKLRNNGPDRIPISRLDVELEVFGKAIARAEKRVERLDPGSESEARVQIPSAPIIASTNGSLSVNWRADVEDSDLTNNVYKIPLALTLRMPDLLPVKFNVDRDGTLSFMINNKGNAKAAASVTAVYVNGALVERFNTQEIGPRGSQHFRYKEMKLTTEDKIAIVADFNADIEESSEENNRISLPL